MDITTGCVYRHRKTQTAYRVLVLGRMEASQDRVVVYQKLNSPESEVWVRPLKEFADGRFEEVPVE